MTCPDCGTTIPDSLIPALCPACARLANQLLPGGVSQRLKTLEAA